MLFRSQNFRYRLEIENETPIIRGTVASDILTGKVDKPVEIEVTLERLHGCAEEGTIRVLGLPPEYTCEPASSKLKEESEKKVVLKVAAIPKPDGTPQVPWSGPITIEIETAGRPIKPPATATNTKLPWLWLKIAP